MRYRLILFSTLAGALNIIHKYTKIARHVSIFDEVTKSSGYLNTARKNESINKKTVTINFTPVEYSKYRFINAITSCLLVIAATNYPFPREQLLSTPNTHIY